MVPEPSNSSPLERFLDAIWKDVKANTVRPLKEYLARFPGDELRFAHEYAAILWAQREASASSPEVEPAGRGDGQRIGPYRVISEIGRGGQATVYVAEDTRLSRIVALKVLDPGSATTKGAIERFRREATITSKLEHPGICPVYDVGTHNGVSFIAMRYVEGDVLAKRITTARERATGGDMVVIIDHPDSSATKPVTAPIGQTTVVEPTHYVEIDRVLLLIEKAARALHAAHELGVIHRDIKPGNIMVTPDDQPVILDFGLAQEIESDLPTLTQTGDFFGTPTYMSPEQLLAQRIRLDRRTDIWSLGVTLFECLTLKRPFDAPTRDGLFQAIQSKDPPDLRSLNPKVTRDLRVVVATALEKDRDRRYQTAEAFAEDLRRVRMREPILAKPAGPIVRLVRWSQRKPGLAAALGGVIAALVISTVLLVQVSSERDAKQTALNDYDRLGDISRLQSLTAEADRLWPSAPTKVSAMKAWMDQGYDLEKRLPGHRDVLDRLRASVGTLPYTDQDRVADLKAHSADQAQLEKLRTEREQMAAAFAAAESRGTPASEPASDAAPRPSADAIRSSLAKIDADIRRLGVRIHERLTWKFGTTAEQFKYDTTAKLVADLSHFVDPDPRKGLLAEMQKRLQFAESVQQETTGKYSAKWSDAIRSIADVNECPEYGGLRLDPQLGLVPIGRNPDSGLWEFSDLATATNYQLVLPERSTDGKLDVPPNCGLIFVLLPGNTFWMGSQAADELAPNFDRRSTPAETPPNQVTLDPFFLAKFEMTQAQWQWVTGFNPSVFGDMTGQTSRFQTFTPKHPVEGVSWNDCVNVLTHLGLDLPTEAQWEYACRGRTSTPWSTGPDEESLQDAANLLDQSSAAAFPTLRRDASLSDGWAYHSPIGSFRPNRLGLHDMHGNVNEWCRDGISQDDISGGYVIPPTLGTGERVRRSPAPYRVYRGGSFHHLPADSRSAYRGRLKPTEHNAPIGVRPARKLDR